MKTNFLKIFIFSALVGGMLFIQGCKKDTPDEKNTSSRLTSEYSAEVPYEYYELFLEIDRYSPGYRPPAAARMLAYVGLAAYESVVPGMPEYNSLASSFPGLVLPSVDPNAEYHWPSAVNACMGTIFRHFYPHIRQSDIARLNALENRFVQQFEREISREVQDRSIFFGRQIADAVFNYSRTDVAGHESFRNPHPADYNPPVTGPNGEELWQPSYPDFTRGLFPYWRNVRSFALRDADKIARPPIPFSTDPNSMFYAQALEVKAWVDNGSFEDRWVARFWSDDIFELTFEPAARIIALANQLADEDKINLARAAELYAKMGMALADTGIAIWTSKYHYNVMRPVQYIRKYIDPNWTPILDDLVNNVKGISPPFPAYPSGHSGFGGTGASILVDIFGNSRQFTDRCHANRVEFPGMPRTFNDLAQTGTENAESRMPLGVHFRMDCYEGLRMGQLAARRVIELPWRRR